MARKKDAEPQGEPEPAAVGGEGFGEPAEPFDGGGAAAEAATDTPAPPLTQEPLPGVATREEVNRSVLKDSELKAAGKLTTKAKASLEAARDGILDMVACGSEAPETLEKAAQLLKAATDLVIDAQQRLRGAEV